MKINRKSLLRCLEAVSPGLASREGVLEQGQCFIFQSGRLTTFNGEVACSIVSPLDLEGAVPAEPMLKLLRKIPEEELAVRIDSGQLQIKGRDKWTAIRMESEVRLSLEDMEKPGADWKSLPKGFVGSLGIAVSCVSSDASLPVITCVHLTPDHLESCDNRQLIRCPLETGIAECLVRGSALKSVITMGVEEVNQTDNCLHFRNGNGLVLSCRRYEQNFPSLDGSLQCDGPAVKLPEGLEQVVSRLEVFSSEAQGESLVLVTLTPGEIQLKGSGPSGWHRERYAVEYDGPEKRFVMNSRILLEAVKRSRDCVVGEDRVKVEDPMFTWVGCTGEAS